MTPRRIVEALLQSTAALERAIETEDLIGLATALQARQESFEAIQSIAPLDRETRSMLASLGDHDRVIEVKARERLDQARAEVSRLRQARRRLRTAKTEAPPRFVSQRA